MCEQLKTAGIKGVLRLDESVIFTEKPQMIIK